MKKHTNPALIGGFVVGFLLLLVGAVVLLGSGALFQERGRYVLYFEDALQGLKPGAPVLWRGVEIGTVADFSVKCDLENFKLSTPVYIETIYGRLQSEDGGHDPLRGDALKMLVERGLRASLTTQSMVTGQLAVTLDFHPGTPARYTGGDPDTIELPTISTGGGSFLGTVKLEPLVADLRDAMRGVASLVRSKDLGRAIRTLGDTLEEYRTLGVTINERAGPLLDDVLLTSKSARATLDDFRRTSVSARDLIADAKLTSVSARTTFDQATSSIKSAEGSISRVESRLAETLATWSKLGETTEAEVRPLSSEIQATLKRAQGAIDQFKSTMRSIEKLTSADSATVARLNAALREFANASRAIEKLAKTLERHPESVIRGK